MRLLNPVQSQILIELLYSLNGRITCHEITEKCHVSYSTIAKEKKALHEMGLIDYEERRRFNVDGMVVRHHVVKLTYKGKLVAQLLNDTANLLGFRNEILEISGQLPRARLGKASSAGKNKFKLHTIHEREIRSVDHRERVRMPGGGFTVLCWE